jgi:Mg2+/Co2+ transporter CorB
MEEIVGDIEDEHDEIDDEILKLDENTYLLDGDVSLRDLNRHLGWNLPDDEASTIAGLLINEAETIPSVGEKFHVHGFNCTVMEKSAMQITKIKIEKLPETRLNSEIEL